MTHPLLQAAVRRAIEREVSAHLGRSWQIREVIDCGERASHPALILRGDRLAVFAKLATGRQAQEQAGLEVAGLEMIRDVSGVAVPPMIDTGMIELDDHRAVLLFEALDERVPEHRTLADWRSIGRTLGALHTCTATDFGGPLPGFFGPLRQDNQPVPSGSWIDFYAQRRVLPWLRTARNAGSIDDVTTRRVEQLLERLGELAGPEPRPALLHGDAQHHNFVSTDAGAVVIDAAPSYGHPEVDLALLDYFSPIPADTFSAYAEICPLDAGFIERRELWRIFAYLGVLTVDATTPFGARFLPRLDAALARYEEPRATASTPPFH